MDYLAWFGEALLALLAWIWALLGILFSIWFVGPMLQLAFLAGIAWLLYRYTPSRVRTFAHRRVLPALGISLLPLRWYLTRLIAKPEWLSQPGDPAPVYIEKRVEVPVPVPVRRSFKAWLMRGLRWSLATAVVILLVILNWGQGIVC